MLPYPPPPPSKTDANFGGWYTDNELKNPFFFTTKITKNTTLYAGWNPPDHYTVRFNTNGGTVIPEHIVASGNTVIKPQNDPTLEGASFIGWYTDTTFSTLFNFDIDTITKNTIIYAGWNLTVRFNTNGGIPVPDEQTIPLGTKATKPTNAPTKKGYVFVGWYEDEALSKKFNFDTAITKNITLYAGWGHTVRFASNGGTPVPDEQIIPLGTKATKPTNAPTKKGYVFVGWYEDEALSKKFNFDTAITKNITLYAGWGHTVRFASNGGTPVPDEQIIPLGTKATKPTNAPTKKGYVFVGWYEDEALKTKFNFDTVIIKNTIIYAGWGHTVQFNLNGGTPAIATQTVLTGQLASKPKDPTKNRKWRGYYTFVGWYTDEALSKKFNFDTVITNPLTLYAGWGHTVQFESNGGTAIKAQKVLDGQLARKPKDPIKDGYTFFGWYEYEVHELIFYDRFRFYNEKINEDITLYALWGHTVQFNLNGGTPAIATQTVFTGQLARKPKEPAENWLQRGGGEHYYTFVGWYEDEALTKKFNFAVDKITKDIILYAGWGFKVWFGDTAIKTQKVLEGQLARKPKDPIKDGYTFLGWYETLTKKFNFAVDKITEDIILYAGWGHTVQFESNGGTAIKAQKVVDGQWARKPKDPTKKGYTFVGWYRDKAFNYPFNFDTEKITEDIILYAGWGHTVQFESNGGTAIKAQKVVDGRKVTKPSDPTKKDYTFVGWYEDEALTKKFNFAVDKITKDIILYADWKHTVHFYLSGGDSPAIATQTVLTGQLASKPKDPTKKGYTFVGWYETLTKKFNFAVDKITKDILLVARWGHTVRFESNGGTAIEAQKVVDGQLARKPKDPTKKGYTFFGWYTDEAFKDQWEWGFGVAEPFNFDTEKITKDTTLYASWGHTVQFESNGGTDIKAQKVVDGRKVTKPSDPIKDGYTFFGWYTDEAFKNTFNFAVDKITKDIILYAGWGHTVQFNLNGGYFSSAIAPQKVVDGQLARKPKDPTKKRGWSDYYYTFVGWYEDEALSKKFNFDTDTITANTILYAGWGRTVQFESNGGTAIKAQKVVDGRKVTKPSDPIKDGYTFVGWYTDKALKNQFNFATDTITKDIILYAGWGHTVQFESNGGTAIKAQKVVDRRKVTKPSDPIKDGYTFFGWYTDKALKTKFNFDTAITKNITLYAGWGRTVQFESNGGTAIKTQKVLTGQLARKPKDPIKDGYTFFGWYTDAKLTKVFNFDTVITKNITLYAGWGHTVRFESNGGTAIKAQKVFDGRKVTKPSDPIKGKHAFVGWYTDEAFKNMFNFAVDKITKDTTLYAGWTFKLRMVSVGWGHTVGIEEDGMLLAWGNNQHGQLGNGSGGKFKSKLSGRISFTIVLPTWKTLPVKVGDDKWKLVSAGGHHTVGIKEDGTLWAWGYNYYGQLGNGESGYNKGEAISVKVGDDKWKLVSAGHSHTVGIKADGTLWAWGYNWGQLGDGTTDDKSSPVQVGKGTWKAVSAGYRHTMGIKDDGTLWAWGYNWGQLGDGTTKTRYRPVQVGKGTWKAVSAGYRHTMGIKDDGTLWAWGKNGVGRLGDGTTKTRYRPVQVGKGTWKAVSAGRSHTVGIKEDGTLWAWGWNEYGQLGNGEFGWERVETRPVKVGDDKWKLVSAGGRKREFTDDYYIHSIDITVGIKEDGTLWAWGDNEYGQLGNGESGELERETRPVPIIKWY